ncbi:hypothetical protein BDY19DRAFT_858173, partial [Irpex rosettiformis]
QSAGKKEHERDANKWNAFLSKRVKDLNNELPEGAQRLKASELSAKLSLEWKAMSLEERNEVTVEAKANLLEVREMKKHAVHNTDINSFHDARATLESIQTKLQALHNRTGTESLLIAVRSSSSSFLHPRISTTSDRIDDYFQLQTKVSTAQFAGMLESYLLSGIEGAIKTYQSDLAELRQKTAKLIQDKLQFIVRPDKVGRMYYQNFDDHITERFGIVIENWPLKTFVNPGSIPTRLELKTLFHAWDSGATFFRRLNPE